MSDLVLTSEAPRAANEAKVGHRERVGLRKLGSPAGFKFFAWRMIGPSDSGDCLLTGCVVTRRYTKGKRAGEWKYDGRPQQVVVSGAEFLEERRRFEAETGLCAVCEGTREEWAGWSEAEGTRMRTCGRCKGSGKPPSSKETR